MLNITKKLGKWGGVSFLFAAALFVSACGSEGDFDSGLFGSGINEADDHVSNFASRYTGYPSEDIFIIYSHLGMRTVCPFRTSAGPLDPYGGGLGGPGYCKFPYDSEQWLDLPPATIGYVIGAEDITDSRSTQNSD